MVTEDQGSELDAWQQGVDMRNGGQICGRKVHTLLFFSRNWREET